MLIYSLTFDAMIDQRAYVKSVYKKGGLLPPLIACLVACLIAFGVQAEVIELR